MNTLNRLLSPITSNYFAASHQPQGKDFDYAHKSRLLEQGKLHSSHNKSGMTTYTRSIN